MKNTSNTRLIGAALALTVVVMAGSAATAPLQGQVDDSQILRVLCALPWMQARCAAGKITTDSVPSTKVKKTNAAPGATTKNNERVILKEGLKTAPTGDTPFYMNPTTVPAPKTTEIPSYGAPAGPITAPTFYIPTPTVQPTEVGVIKAAPGCGDGICVAPEIGDASKLVTGQSFVWCPADCEGKTPIKDAEIVPACGDGICQNTEGNHGCDPYIDPITGKAAGCDGYHMCMSDCAVKTFDCPQTACAAPPPGMHYGKTAIGDNGCQIGCGELLKDESTPAICGNGKIEGAEICDDGNKVNNDGCNSECRQDYVISKLPVCGNGEVENGEQCDFGSLKLNAEHDCNATCWFEKKYDPLACNWDLSPIPSPQSTCAEGENDKAAKFDYRRKTLSSPCEWVEQVCKLGWCGNKIIEGNEECDNGLPAYNNGNCHYCRILALCGNGIVEKTEGCDEGKNNGTGIGLCSAQCQKEAPKPVCGNGIREGNEACDDGNTKYYDTCNNDCNINNPSIGMRCGGIFRAADYVRPDLSKKVHGMTVLYEDKTTKSFSLGNDCETGFALMERAKKEYTKSPLCEDPYSVAEDNLTYPTCNGAVQPAPAASSQPKCGDGVHHWSEECDLGTRNGATDSPCTTQCRIKYFCEPSDCASMLKLESTRCAMNPTRMSGFTCNNDIEAEAKIAEQLNATGKYPKIEIGGFGAKACKLQETSCVNVSGDDYCGSKRVFAGKDCDMGMDANGKLINNGSCTNCSFRNVCKSYETATYEPGTSNVQDRIKEYNEYNSKMDVCGSMQCFANYKTPGYGRCGCQFDSDCTKVPGVPEGTPMYCNKEMGYICVKKI